MIVIADDDRLYDQDLKMILELEGYKDVRVVETCHGAMEVFRAYGSPQALVLDLAIPWDEQDANGGMPLDNPEDMRGLRLARELKEQGYDMRRVVVITAFPSDAVNRLLGKLEIANENILVKPARTGEILRRIRTGYSIREN